MTFTSALTLAKNFVEARVHVGNINDAPSLHVGKALLDAFEHSGPMLHRFRREFLHDVVKRTPGTLGQHLCSFESDIRDLYRE